MTGLSLRNRQVRTTEAIRSPQRRDGNFRNAAPRERPGVCKTFGIAFMETGAYDAQWPDIHMQSEQTLQAVEAAPQVDASGQAA